MRILVRILIVISLFTTGCDNLSESAIKILTVNVLTKSNDSLSESDGHSHPAVPVDMYFKDGVFIKSFSSMVEAQKEIGIKSKSNIIQCCKGEMFSAGGYRWTFKEDKLQNRRIK